MSKFSPHCASSGTCCVEVAGVWRETRRFLRWSQCEGCCLLCQLGICQGLRSRRHGKICQRHRKVWFHTHREDEFRINKTYDLDIYLKSFIEYGVFTLFFIPVPWWRCRYLTERSMSGGPQLQPFRKMWGDRLVSQKKAQNDFNLFVSIINTAVQLFFTWEKFSRGLREPIVGNISCHKPVIVVWLQ